MTEELLRERLREAVTKAMDKVPWTIYDIPPGIKNEAVEAAEQLVLPVVETMVQEALEQGFNGRPDAEAPMRVTRDFLRGAALAVPLGLALWAMIGYLAWLAVEAAAR